MVGRVVVGRVVREPRWGRGWCVLGLRLGLGLGRGVVLGLGLGLVELVGGAGGWINDR